MAKEDIPLDQLIVPTLKAIARTGPYFTTREVVSAILRKKGLSDAIADIRRAHPGQRFDIVIMRYVEDGVAHALRARDEHGLRIYECYRTESGAVRWMPFRSMRIYEVRRTLSDARVLRDNLIAKVALLEAVLAELERAKRNATVDDVYGRIIRRRDLITHERKFDVA